MAQPHPFWEYGVEQGPTGFLPLALMCGKARLPSATC